MYLSVARGFAYPQYSEAETPECPKAELGGYSVMNIDRNSLSTILKIIYGIVIGNSSLIKLLMKKSPCRAVLITRNNHIGYVILTKILRICFC